MVKKNPRDRLNRHTHFGACRTSRFLDSLRNQADKESPRRITSFILLYLLILVSKA